MSQREIFKPFSLVVSGIANASSRVIGLSGTAGVPVHANYISVQTIQKDNTEIDVGSNVSYFTVAPRNMYNDANGNNPPNGYTATGINVSAAGPWDASGGGIGGVVVAESSIGTLSLPDGMRCAAVEIRNDTGGDMVAFAISFGIVRFSNPMRDGSIPVGM